MRAHLPVLGLLLMLCPSLAHAGDTDPHARKKLLESCFNGDAKLCVDAQLGDVPHFVEAQQACGAKPTVEIDEALVANDLQRRNDTLAYAEEIFGALAGYCTGKPAAKAKVAKLKTVRFTLVKPPAGASPGMSPPVFSLGKGKLVVGFYKNVSNIDTAASDWLTKHL